MSREYTSFVPDLRYPENALSGDKWSLWSSQPMIELSARNTYSFVKAMLPYRAQRILEVGCGDGYLSLELARDGYEVIGLDISAEIIEVAERTRAAHPDTPGFGKLTYYCADINTWQASEGSFDVVIITRTLHHLHMLQTTTTKMRQLLRRNGRLICQDYAYDRLNEQTASWMYSMQRLLFLSGLSDEDVATAADDAQSIEALQTAWFQRSKHRLNRYEEMLQMLQAAFHQQLFSWIPYLFVYIGNGIRHTTSEQEQTLLIFLKNMEHYHIEKGHIQAVGFRYVGSKS